METHELYSTDPVLLTAIYDLAITRGYSATPPDHPATSPLWLVTVDCSEADLQLLRRDAQGVKLARLYESVPDFVPGQLGRMP